MNKEQKIEESIRLNKKKWDNWADENILDNHTVKFLGLKFNFDFHKFQAMAVDLVDKKDNIRFLDIGCGTGWAVNYAFKVTKGDGEYYGLDISQKMIDKAIELYGNNKKLHFLQGNASMLPYEDNTFDAITSTNSFHHYPEPEKALLEIQRVLKPGGCLYLLDPTTDGLLSKLVNILGKIVEKEHVNMYSTNEYKRMFSKSGLEYIHRHKIGPINTTKIHVGRKMDN